MVKEYYDATSDLEFIKTLLPTLETEFHFWLNNRQFILERSDKPKIRYFQYRVNSTEPRW